MNKRASKPKSRELKGWNEIAEFLGQTVSVAQRWQKSGMPVTREERSVYASPEALTAWVSTERGKSQCTLLAKAMICLRIFLMSASSRRSEVPEPDRMK
jgi:hypothetical protein